MTVCIRNQKIGFLIFLTVVERYSKSFMQKKSAKNSFKTPLVIKKAVSHFFLLVLFLLPTVLILAYFVGIQGGVINHGLKCFFFNTFFQCIGLHALLKPMLALKVLVIACSAVG
jgi:hypothetical protein